MPRPILPAAGRAWIRERKGRGKRRRLEGGASRIPSAGPAFPRPGPLRPPVCRTVSAGARRPVAAFDLWGKREGGSQAVSLTSPFSLAVPLLLLADELHVAP